MAEFILKADKRQDTGKQFSKQLRREGKVPGIYYIHGEDSTPFVIDEKQLQDALHSEASIMDLQIGNDNTTKCVIRDIQWHPLTDRPLHVDLMGVKMTEEIEVEVPIHLVGEPIGVKRDGGILQHAIREIYVQCLPGDIPEHFELDVSGLEIGDKIAIEDLKIEKVKILNEATQTIAVVVPPRLEAEPTVEEEEPTEPELVGEKEDEEEAEGDEERKKEED